MDNLNIDYNRFDERSNKPILNSAFDREEETVLVGPNNDHFINNSERISFNQFGNMLEQEIEKKSVTEENNIKLISLEKVLICSSVISYYFISVIELMEFNKIQDLCNKSIDIWLYMLLSLTFNFVLFINSSFVMTKYNINKPLALYLVIAFYKTIFCTWISIEFISNPCFDKIKDTKLSQLASIQLLFDASIIIFSIINIYKINSVYFDDETTNSIEFNRIAEDNKIQSKNRVQYTDHSIEV